MQNNPIRVGIIGAGFGQHVLLPAFRSIDHVVVRGIATTSLQRSQTMADQYHLPKAYVSWQAMLDDPDIDALVIAVPPAVQQIIIREALQRNKHLFCEKPLGVSAEVTQAFASEAAHKKLANSQREHTILNSKRISFKDEIHKFHPAW